MMTTRTSILLADDHPLILDGLEQLFRTEDGIEVIARCRNGRDALEKIRSLRPSLAIIDLRMPEMSGLEVLEEAGNDTRVILLTAEIDDGNLIQALKSGARGLILKERAAELLLDCVDAVISGERWIDPDIAGRALRLMEANTKKEQSRGLLSPREIEIARGVAEGLRNRAIAERLFITEGTVKTHLRSIFEKAGVDSRLGLANWARRQGLLD